MSDPQTSTAIDPASREKALAALLLSYRLPNPETAVTREDEPS